MQRSTHQSWARRSAIIGAALFAACAFGATGDGSPADANIKYVGRWDTSAAATATSDWPGAYLRTGFSGTGASVKLAASASFYVSVDGGTDVLYSSQSGTVKVASGLASGSHTLRVTAVTNTDSLQFQGLVLDSGATTIAAQRRDNLVEFIGDSITAGLMVPSSSNQYVRSENDYAWLISEALGADHTQIAYPGICLVDALTCYAPNNIGMSNQYFKLQTVDYPSSPSWNFATYQPRAVVINLGTNDAQAITYLNNGGTDSQFQSVYQTFLQNIRAKYPATEIFVLRTFGGFKVAPTKAAVQAVVAAGDAHLHYVDTANWLVAADYWSDGIHPNVAGHVKIARMLGPLLKPYTTGFKDSFEAGETAPQKNTVLSSANVNGYNGVPALMETYTNTGTKSHVGAASLTYSGSVPKSISGWNTYSYNKLYDVNIPVIANTELSYWLYPAANSNSTFVAIDLVFTDGTVLRNLGAVDQNGNSVHPMTQGSAGKLTVNAWNFVKSKIGAVAAGKTIQQIVFGYQNQSVTGQFYGYVDDLQIVNAPFINGLESGDQAISGTNLTQSSNNVTGYWGGAGTPMETYSTSPAATHTGSGALTFSGAVTASLTGWQTYAFNKVFDVSIPVDGTTYLSYWLYPGANSTSTFTGIDLVFTDGTVLRNLGAVDQNGVSMHPMAQGSAVRVLNDWNFVASWIGQVAAGKTIQQIVFGFQAQSVTGQFYGYVDDLLIH